MDKQEQAQMKPGDSASLKAIKECAFWLDSCLSFSWPKSALDDLQALWWRFHDDNGNLINPDAKEI